MIITTYNTVFVKINGNNLDSLKKCLAIRYFLIKIHLKALRQSLDQVGSFMHTGGKAILGLQNDPNFPKNSQVFQTLRFGRFPESVENRPRQEIQNPPTRT